MSKSVTVTFQDGSSHTYDNVPDEVTDDQVTARAGDDFADKTISGVVGGIAPGAAETAAPTGPVVPNDLSMGEKVAGGVATAANLAMEHPGLAAGAAGLWKANKVANAYINAKQAEAAATNARTNQMATRTEQMAQTEARVAQRPGFGNVPKGGAPAQPSGLVDAAGNPMSSAPKPTMANLPAPGAAPVPEAPPSNANYMQRMTQLADRYLPAAKQAASTAGRVLAPVARVLGSAPVMGAQLALTPSTLNANEDEELRRRRAMQPSFTFPQQ